MDIQMLDIRIPPFGPGPVGHAPWHEGPNCSPNGTAMNEAGEGTVQDRTLTLKLFMRHLAHELGNPVASIRMSAEMLVGDFPPEMHRELFQIILSESQRLESLIESAVYFASINTVNPGETEIAALMDSVIRQNSITVPVQIQNATGLDVLQGDASQLVRLFREIFQNATQAGASRIGVTLQKEEEGIVVTVEDDGTGVAEEKLPLLFNPFYTSRDGQLGLGLNIAQRIVQLHHGTIDIASTSANSVKVTIRLPQSF